MTARRIRRAAPAALALSIVTRDGSGVGIHRGTGAGFYSGWGDASLIRLEVAYSPDAFSLHLPFGTSAPLGLYVQDGVMF